MQADGSPRPGSSTAFVSWWSFTKTLLATCAMRLVEQGRLDLDRPVEGYPFTLRHLLQHRAGVGNYGGMPAYEEAIASGQAPWNDAELFARVPLDRLLFEPGSGFAYSNVGYLLVRRLVERARGTDLGTVLQDLVLKPLGLGSARLATTREDMDATVFTGGHGYHPGWAFHGTVVGPASEAALCLHRLLTGDLLAARSLAAMRRGQPVGGPVPGRPWMAPSYGLGLMTGTMRAPDGTPIEVLGHSAGGPGSVGAVYHAPATGRTVAVFAERDGDAAEYEAVRLLALAERPLSI